MKKERINSISFIKVICMIGIIASHFSSKLISKEFLLFHTFANGDWGSVFAQIFLMVSGALLYYNYEKKIKLKEYYKKRWKSIFPTFYLAYFLVELFRVINNKKISHLKIFPYIYTILGMDGYLINNTTTYYILGEWFLGMIIILYIVFPFILKCFKKNNLLTMFISIFIYLLFLDKTIINPVSIWSITSCGLSFVLGMFIIKNRNIIINKFTMVASFVSILILTYMPLEKSLDISLHLMSAYLFIFLIFIGEWIMKSKINNKMFGFLNKYSYAIFLLQHEIIFKILTRYNPASPIKIFGLFLIDVLVTIVFAIILTKLVEIISKIIKKLVKIFKDAKSIVCLKN